MLSFLTGSTINRVLALAALILAFPPVFSKRTHNEGLLMSLSLALFYGGRGLFSLADRLFCTRFIAVRPSQFFAFTELPSIIISVYVGLKWLPDWLAAPYQWALLSAGPVFLLLEGLSSMIIILECGERLSDIFNEASTPVKAAVAAVCFGVYGLSFYVIWEIYRSGLLGALSARYTMFAYYW